jgi:histidine ammonia-lyase
MVFADAREIISGGNFHGAPVAIAADLLCLGLAQLATISERRSERLVNPALSGLPAFLTRHGGLQSGLMMAQVTAAALTSELKTLAHPASVDTIPTSANKEDHVSMSMAAGLKASRVLEFARGVIAIELLCACQALDLLAPLETSAPLTRVHHHIRSRVPTLDRDRPPSHDVASITELIVAGEIERACAMKVN